MLATTATATNTKLLLSKPINTLPAADSGLLFREKLIYLSDLNINTHKALTLNTNLRSTPLSSLVSVEETLFSFGLRRSSLGRILDMHPSLLTSDPHLHFYPVLYFLLHEVVIPFPQISKCLYRCPRILVSSVSNQLRPALGFLRSIGFVGPSSIDAHTSLLLVYNVEFTLMSKIEYLVGLGFEFDEVKGMVARSPGLLTLSIDRNLVPKTEYFVKEMKGDLKELMRFPQYFSFSLERKIRPRHRMLEEYGLKLPLSKMLKFSDGEFNARLVDMLSKNSGREECVGMWWCSYALDPYYLPVLSSDLIPAPAYTLHHHKKHRQP